MKIEVDMSQYPKEALTVFKQVFHIHLSKEEEGLIGKYLSDAEPTLGSLEVGRGSGRRWDEFLSDEGATFEDTNICIAIGRKKLVLKEAAELCDCLQKASKFIGHEEETVGFTDYLMKY